ncbi:MAG: hypothetical protein HKP38_03480 [Croceitalea sp.]|nr:hypothetical protein [Croceitalea sp.]MBT8237269.1 hypothetical protein [Croceitalea sp.]NNC34640.1 hypothetical protein [Croceitalea sp.]NNL08264.1 hypothetical protein [Croceitalea sp.]NNM19272.1 hypothetical protein [Croceitalea sp.]
MKSILNKTTVAALMFVTMAGFANGPKNSLGKKVNEVETSFSKFSADPVFSKKGNKIFLNILNLDQEKVTIRVYDSANRLVYKETLKGELIVEKVFNFESAFEDDYTIVVVDNNQTFKEVIEVK